MLSRLLEWLRLSRVVAQVEQHGACGYMAVATCPVCRARTRSTVLHEEGDLANETLGEFFACERCQTLLAETCWGATRLPATHELRSFRRRWPLIWESLERGQRAWRANERGGPHA